jgi:phosphatidylserine/phosphatidylglycerophosphate/cardiolipin synthase-like enzyme
MIRAARRRIYIETQYFASRVVAEALAKRLSKRDAPEVVIINPRTGEGWLDDSVMSAARYHLFEALREADVNDRFRIYYPVTEGSQDIYVHAKIMIVDDLYLRVGSANLNNRSMGLDSECDVVVDGRDDASARKAIRAIQADLMAEHLGVTPRKIETALETEGSLIGAIEALRGSGRTLWPLDPTRPGGLRSVVSLSEALDPEASESFEPSAHPGLLRHFRQFGGRAVSQPSAEAQGQAPASARRAKARSGANNRRPRD